MQSQALFYEAGCNIILFENQEKKKAYITIS